MQIKVLTDISVEHSWVDFLPINVNTEINYPPILSLKLNRAELASEDGALELVKDYSNKFIDFFFNNEIINENAKG